MWRDKSNGKIRIDVENPAPGKRPGQIHYQDEKGNKYLYDPKNNTFIDAPNKVNDKINMDKTFASAIDRALDKYLGIKK